MADHNPTNAGHDTARNLVFEEFAKLLVKRNDDRLFNDGPDEQAGRVTKALRRIDRVAPLIPLTDSEIDLAGFGTAPLIFTATLGDRGVDYLLLSHVADELGWFMPRAHDWAELEAGYAVEDQRTEDEDRGDGRIGWDCMRDYIRLDIDLIVDDPEAKPDANGKQWSSYSDWLISRHRLPNLLASSPWSKEFMDNVMPAFSYSMREIWGDKLKDIPTYSGNGVPTGSSLYDALCDTEGLTEEEALQRARRGPSLDAPKPFSCTFPGCTDSEPHSVWMHQNRPERG
ncbi:hypothetical protein [Streptomyces sp. JV180]|uniref:hypothetical protein n=1 Tax=Streptomyces sp. JV180 TaxID=858634 RepID=UPI00168B2666|nr:hypothetical protein [Streptomyces sp. JV180]MBD3544490.1 hypothetical protein [Streptomyces sp. JV180]